MRLPWYIPKKGYGFIQPKDGGRDVFLHVSALQKANIDSLSKKTARRFMGKEAVK